MQKVCLTLNPGLFSLGHVVFPRMRRQELQLNQCNQHFSGEHITHQDTHVVCLFHQNFIEKKDCMLFLCVDKASQGTEAWFSLSLLEDASFPFFSLKSHLPDDPVFHPTTCVRFSPLTSQFLITFLLPLFLLGCINHLLLNLPFYMCCSSKTNSSWERTIGWFRLCVVLTAYLCSPGAGTAHVIFCEKNRWALASNRGTSQFCIN